MLTGKILLLLFVANGAPIILTKLLGNRYARPLDGGLVFLDGRALLGASKTWRGVIGSLLVTPIAAILLGFPAAVGFTVALGAMMGDCCSSFIKRRLGIRASGKALGLDQIPESLLPLLLLSGEWDLALEGILLLVFAFFVMELLLSRILYWLDIRQQPY